VDSDEGSRPRGRGFESSRMDVSDDNEITKIKVAEWGTPKKIFKKSLKQILFCFPILSLEKYKY
jgi:hypothetical protein